MQGVVRGAHLIIQLKVVLRCSVVSLYYHMNCSPPGSLSMAFFRQEYWSGLPFPSPGDLPDPRIESTSPALAGRFFTTELPGKIS